MMCWFREEEKDDDDVGNKISEFNATAILAYLHARFRIRAAHPQVNVELRRRLEDNSIRVLFEGGDGWDNVTSLMKLNEN